MKKFESIASKPGLKERASQTRITKTSYQAHEKLNIAKNYLSERNIRVKCPLLKGKIRIKPRNRKTDGYGSPAITRIAMTKKSQNRQKRLPYRKVFSLGPENYPV